MPAYSADKVAAPLRDSIHCHHRLAHEVTRLLCKTKPNEDCGQNRKTSFSLRKMNVSIHTTLGDETFFYETKPNEKQQVAD